MHRAFPRQFYGPRAKIETVFSVIKRKLSSKASGRSLPMQMRQALLLGLAFNLYRLRHRPAPGRCKQSHSELEGSLRPLSGQFAPNITVRYHSVLNSTQHGLFPRAICGNGEHGEPRNVAFRQTLLRVTTNEPGESYRVEVNIAEFFSFSFPHFLGHTEENTLRCQIDRQLYGREPTRLGRNWKRRGREGAGRRS